MTNDKEPDSETLRRAAAGDSVAIAEAFSGHRPRLRRMVQLRLDRRLQGRIDPSDVLQEAYLEVARSLADYLKNPEIPFYLWVRFITGRKLQAVHRHHLGTLARDAGREVFLHRGALPQASSVSLAEQLLGRYASPSQAAVKAELQIRVQEALNGMDAIDREVLAFERQWWKYAGAKEQAIRDLFDMSATRYYQVLNALIDSPEALVADPMLVKRLRRLRSTRQRTRSARRLGLDA